MDKAKSDLHSCHYCQSLVLDPLAGHELNDSDFKSLCCPCLQCKKWVRAMATAQNETLEGSFFCVLDGQYMLKARNGGCATARELCDTWDETDDQCIDYLQENDIPFEMTNIIVSCIYKKPSKHDICRLRFRGPHLISIRGQHPKGDYGVCIEDEYGVAADRDDPSSRYITGREAHRETDHPEVYHMAARWFQECVQYHSACQSPSLSINLFKPSRLLQVNDPGLGFNYVKIVSTDHLNSSAKYTALSYCWGGDQLGKTTRANLGTRLQSLRVSDQHKTIRDAIKITRRLNFPYLWIDSLCIVQDDPKDVENELACMDKVYEYADLLISATSAKASTEGILNPAIELPANVSCGYRCPSGETGTILLQKAGYEPGTLGVHGRCWTLQEHLLSPRILAYAGSGLRWSCRTTTLFDGPWTTSTVFINYLENIETYRRMSAILSSDVPDRVPTIADGQATTLNVDEQLVADLTRKLREPRPDDTLVGTRTIIGYEEESTVSKYSAITQWRTLLREFTSRSITNPADRLPAISAAARKFNNILPGRYIAGLWEIALPLELLWEPKGGSKKGRDQEISFPSWSWASICYRIEWHIPSAGVTTLQCLDARLDFLYPSVPYGHVIKGRLRVRGNLMPVKCEAIDEALDPNDWQLDSDLPLRVGNSAFLVPRSDGSDAALETRRTKILAMLDEKMEINDLQDLYCLEVLRVDPATPRMAFQPSVGLVLTPIDKSGAAFSRIGLFGMQRGRLTVFRKAETGGNMMGNERIEGFWRRGEVLLV